jgi:hypothetical protein
MGLLTHEGLFLPFCVFDNAPPVEVEGSACPLLACVFSPVQLADQQPKKRNWFASRARKLSVRFFNSAKSGRGAGSKLT